MGKNEFTSEKCWSSTGNMGKLFRCSSKKWVISNETRHQKLGKFNAFNGLPDSMGIHIDINGDIINKYDNQRIDSRGNLAGNDVKLPSNSGIPERTSHQTIT